MPRRKPSELPERPKPFDSVARLVAVEPVEIGGQALGPPHRQDEIAAEPDRTAGVIGKAIEGATRTDPRDSALPVIRESGEGLSRRRQRLQVRRRLRSPSPRLGRQTASSHGRRRRSEPFPRLVPGTVADLVKRPDRRLRSLSAAYRQSAGCQPEKAASSCSRASPWGRVRSRRPTRIASADNRDHVESAHLRQRIDDEMRTSAEKCRYVPCIEQGRGRLPHRASTARRHFRKSVLSSSLDAVPRSSTRRRRRRQRGAVLCPVTPCQRARAMHRRSARRDAGGTAARASTAASNIRSAGRPGAGRRKGLSSDRARRRRRDRSNRAKRRPADKADRLRLAPDVFQLPGRTPSLARMRVALGESCKPAPDLAQDRCLLEDIDWRCPCAQNTGRPSGRRCRRRRSRPARIVHGRDVRRAGAQAALTLKVQPSGTVWCGLRAWNCSGRASSSRSRPFSLSSPMSMKMCGWSKGRRRRCT